VRRLLIDVNVVLDAVLDRPPHSAAAARLWALAEAHEVEALVPAHGITTVFYLVARARDRSTARRAVERIMATFNVAPVDVGVLRRALALGGPDFEDSVCVGAAEAAGCEALVTRDPAGFPDTPLAVVEPPTALALLSGGGPEGVAEATARYGTRRGRRARPRARRKTRRRPRR
jgi:predicted nucleic acid-binding protein